MVTRRAVLAATGALTAAAGCSELYGSPDDPDRRSDGREANGTDGDMAVQQLEGSGEATLLSVTELEGDGEWPLVAYGHVDEVADVGGLDDHHWAVVTLTDAGWGSFHEGFADAKVFENREAFRMRTHLDGDVVFSGEMNRDLVNAVEDGDWAGTLRVSTETRDQAEQIAQTIEDL